MWEDDPDALEAVARRLTAERYGHGEWWTNGQKMRKEAERMRDTPDKQAARRQDLLREVWGSDHDTELRVVSGE